MTALTEPQVWVLIAIFGAAIFSMLGIQTASLNRNVTTAISALRDSMESKFDGLRAEVNGRFDATNAKIDALDRDVHVLSQRVFGTD